MGVLVARSTNPISAYRDHLEPQVQDAGKAAQAGSITAACLFISRYCLSDPDFNNLFPY